MASTSNSPAASRSVTRQSSIASVNDITQAGWLEKRTSGGALTTKKWRKRWFQLAGTRIEYGKTDHEQVQVIILTRECHAETEGPGKKAISIITPSRKYHCRAKTAEEAQGWVDAIKAARDTCKKRAFHEVLLHKQKKGEKLGLTIGGGIDCTDEGKKDIFVVKLDPSGLAAEGLQKGDIITQVNSKSFVAITHAKAQKILASARGAIVLKVSRRDRKSRVASPPPAASSGAGGVLASGALPAPAAVPEPVVVTSKIAPTDADAPPTDADAQPTDEEAEKAKVRLERRNRMSQKRLERKQSEKLEVDNALRLIDELPE